LTEATLPGFAERRVMSKTTEIAETRRRIKELKLELRVIERKIGGIARIASFLTEKQLAPYNALADDHTVLEMRLKRLQDRLFELIDQKRGRR
jgi:hypothetical protein